MRRSNTCFVIFLALLATMFLCSVSAPVLAEPLATETPAERERERSPSNEGLPDGDLPDQDLPDNDLPDGDLPDQDLPDGDLSSGEDL